MVSTLTLLVLTAIAAYTDATRHKIYNWTTYPGIIAGIVTQASLTAIATASRRSS